MKWLFVVSVEGKSPNRYRAGSEPGFSYYGYRVGSRSCGAFQAIGYPIVVRKRTWWTRYNGFKEEKDWEV